jgi:cytochrome c oxidase assembly protein subunit 15
VATLDYKSPDAQKAAPAYHPLLHRTAQITAAATLLLIFMGGLVTSHGAGMSVPDWPNSYGYNMFTFPYDKWVGGIFYEHTHRLMGTVVGVLSIAVTIIAWIVEDRRWVRWLATGVLGAVIFQGVLGGLRVIWVQLNLAVVHACVAQAFFCLVGLLCVVTSRWWFTVPREHPDAGRGIIPVAVTCAIVIYLQLIVGALMRHYEAGLAIPDFPTSYGGVLPPYDQAGLAQANTQRAEIPLPPVSLPQVWLHFGHRLGAIGVAVVALWESIWILRQYREPGLRRPAMALIVLLAIQLTLGALTVLMRKPADIASLHVATGALTLLTSFVLLIRAMRVYSPLWRTATRYLEVRVTPRSEKQPIRQAMVSA